MQRRMQIYGETRIFCSEVSGRTYCVCPQANGTGLVVGDPTKTQENLMVWVHVKVTEPAISNWFVGRMEVLITARAQQRSSAQRWARRPCCPRAHAATWGCMLKRNSVTSHSMRADQIVASASRQRQRNIQISTD